ncbi:MAG: NADH-quinone oxidoreductase subunit H, partial [Thermoproteota archaeon]|nr:NADH-quinone oxidoreductase subunit H [Thermoproteota archaeon]
MASFPENFRFGEFVGSGIWLIFWILAIVALVGLPLIFVILFFVPLPETDGKVFTPYLFLTSILYPQSAIPVIGNLIHSTLFKVAVFPG